MLSSVRFIIRGMKVWAIGVDPYALGIDSSPCLRPDGESDFEMTVPLAEIRRLAYAIRRGGQKPHDVATFDFRGPFGALQVHLRRNTLELELLEGEYPNWRQVVEVGDREPLTTIALAPRILARFGETLMSYGGSYWPNKASKGGMPILRLNFSKRMGPVEFQLGDSFAAMVMPLRVAD